LSGENNAIAAGVLLLLPISLDVRRRGASTFDAADAR
jgi:hypothetical protein